MPGLKGNAGTTATAGDDVINGTVGTASTDDTYSVLDGIDGGAGADTLNISVVRALSGAAGAANRLPAATVSNVETANLKFAAAFGDNTPMDITGWTGLTKANVQQAAADVGLKFAATTDVTTVSTAGVVNIVGGNNVTVTAATADKNITVSAGAATGNAAGAVSITDSNQGSGVITVDGGTTVTVSATTDKATTGNIVVGANKAASGAVSVTQTLTNDAAAAVTAGNVTVTGGSTVTITANLTNTATKDSGAANNITAGTYKVTGDSKTTAVTITQNNVANDYDAETTGATKETATITFDSLKSGEKIAVSSGALTALGTDLTFTASKDLTAAEVAAVFASLTAADKQTTGGKVANGVFSGALDAGWVSAAASGSSVTFTAAATGASADLTLTVKKADGTTNVDNLAKFTTTKVDGSAGTTTTARDVTATYGNVEVQDNATASITSITLNGYGTATIGGTQDVTKLTDLSLANSGGTATIDGGAGITSLNLTVNNVKNAVDISTNSSAVKTLVVTATGAASDFGLTAANVEDLTVKGDKVLDIDTGTTLTALKTVTVSGTAGLNIDATGLANQTSFTTTGTTGTVTATIDATKATYTGGAGVDKVTTSAAAPSKAISLGEGDDTLTLATGTVSATATLSGGGGTDTLVMAAANAVTVSAGTTFKDQIDSFEKLSLGQTATTVQGTVNLANMDDISYVIAAGTADTAQVKTVTLTVGTAIANNDKVSVTINGTTYTTAALTAAATATDIATALDTAVGGGYNVSAAGAVLTFTSAAGGNTAITNLAVTTGTGTVSSVEAVTSSQLTLNKMANNGTVELTAAGTGAVVTMTDATGTTDSLNVITKFAGNVGTIAADGVETVNVTSSAASTLNIVGNAVKTITVAGASALTLTATDSTLTSVDATSATGALTYTGSVASLVVKGSNKADSLTANANDVALYGNDGADTLTVAGGLRVNLYGGAGADTYVFNAGTSANLDSYTVINSAGSGDVIKLTGATSFKQAAITLSVGADDTLLNYANQAMTVIATNEMGWFQKGGNTFIVQDLDGNATFTNGTDMIVMLTGLVDLSTASYNVTSNTLELA